MLELGNFQVSYGWSLDSESESKDVICMRMALANDRAVRKQERAFCESFSSADVLVAILSRSCVLFVLASHP